MEKLLLYENEKRIEQLRASVEQSRGRSQELVSGLKKVGAGEVASFGELLELMLTSPVQKIRKRIVQRAGVLQTSGGFKINHQKMADLLDLPEDEIQTLGQKMEAFIQHPRLNDSHLRVEDGRVKINENSLEAEIETYRFYVDSPEKWEVYNDLLQFSAQVDAIVSKYGNKPFADADIPLLAGGVRTYSPEGNSKTLIREKPYLPDWTKVRDLAKKLVKSENEV